MEIISRLEWKAKYGLGLMTESPKQLVVIHHSSVPNPVCGTSKASEKLIVKDIEKYHKLTKEWDGIGYNFLVFQGGRAYEGRGWHRIGAHTQGQNSKSVGICLVANAENYTVTDAAFETIAEIIRLGVNLGYIKKDFTIKGHKDFAQTECPGKFLYNQLKKIKAMV